MTCIVGVEVGNKVVLAGDIQGSGGNNKIVHTQPKVFKNGEMGFGYTTSYRFGQLIEHSVTKEFVPSSEEMIYPWLIKEFVPHCKKTLQEGGYDGGGNCLIGVKGQLWELQGEFSVLRSTKGFNAVGSGYEYALGAMDTIFSKRDRNMMSVEEVVSVLKDVMVTVSTYCPTVGSDCVAIVVE